MIIQDMESPLESGAARLADQMPLVLQTRMRRAKSGFWQIGSLQQDQKRGRLGICQNLSKKSIPFKQKPPLFLLNSLYLRDTMGLTTENTELKLRLQAMEEQAQFRDAMNEALKQEVERLKIATGEIAHSSEFLNLGVQRVPYSPSASPRSIFTIPQQPLPLLSHMPPFRNFQPQCHNSPQQQFHSSHYHPIPEVPQNYHLAHFHGLDSGNKGSSFTESEGGGAFSASESSSTY